MHDAQTELVPETDVDRLATVRGELMKRLEQAEKARERADARVAEAMNLLDQIDHVIDGFGGQNAGSPTGPGWGGHAEVVTINPSVIVFQPGGKLGTVTEIGSYTRYGELVADWITDIGGADEIDAYSLVDSDGVTRDLHAVIAPTDYGRAFTIEQG